MKEELTFTPQDIEDRRRMAGESLTTQHFRLRVGDVAHVLCEPASEVIAGNSSPGATVQGPSENLAPEAA